MAKVLLSLLALLISVFGTFSFSEEDSVSFYGGHIHESVPPAQQESLTVHFNFRTIQDSGVLLIAAVGSGSDYLAVTLNNGSRLELLMRRNGSISTLGTSNSTTDFSEWQCFELSLANQTLLASLQGLSFATYTFTAPLQIQTVLFSIPESFFSPQYSGFPVPRYFVGCLANMTINSRPVLLDPNEPGLGAGCCIAPRYPSWCLGSPHSNLTLSFPPVRSPTDMLVVSLRLRLTNPSHDGLVMLSHTPTSLWSLQLHQGRLQLTANLSDGVHSRYCPGVLADSTEWHLVELVLSSSSLACSMDGVTETGPLFPSLLSSSVFPRLLQVGGVSELGGGRSFDGCIQRLRLNGVDVTMGAIVAGEAAIQPIEVHWNDFSLNNTDLVVTEGSTEKLSSSMWIRLPRDEFVDPLSSLYLQELKNTIHFTVLDGYGPRYGHLFMGQLRSSRVENFGYSDIVSTDPSRQVAYSHDDPANLTDVVVFRVWAGCAEVEYITLIISVEERDMSLRLRQMETPLPLAVGTRRHITAEVVTVEDPGTNDPTLILYTVLSVSLHDSACSSCPLSECDSCSDVREGGEVLKHGESVRFFHQDDINRGVISFQHYERYSTAPLVIRLEAALEGATDSLLDVVIPVAPYPGFINLTTNPDKECVFVGEDGLALVAPKHLNVFTNFRDQDPVIMYDILTLPQYGLLQWLSPEDQWIDFANTSHQHHGMPLAEAPPTFFTQDDVNEGRVRYVQSGPFSFSGSEIVGFQVRSHDFLSNISSDLCVNIIPHDLLLQPSITLQRAPLVLLEGESAAVNHSVLNTSLAKEEFLVLSPDLQVDVQQLGIVYTLVDPPSYGWLELEGDILVAGDVFAHRDVTSSALVYFHDGSENHDDQFSFYGEAGSVEYLPIKPPNRTSNLTLLVDITPVNNHDPVLDADMEGIRPPEGCWVLVTDDNINVTDMDRPADRLRIYLRKKGATPTGIFAYASEPHEAISQFYMRDVREGRVIFSHHLNSSLNYTQVLRIDDGVNTVKRPIVIAAVPLILNVSFDLPQDSQCFGSIDANLEDLLIRFSGVKFTATLCDEFGNNADLVPSITVTIVDPPQHGQVVRQEPDNSTGPVTQFPFRDMSKLVYILENRHANGDRLVLEFSHGHSIPLRHTLLLCVQPALVPLYLRVATLKLMQGSMVHITSQHLVVNSSREELKEHLVFNVVSAPQHGSLINDDADDMTRHISQFTHGDLTSLAIVYDSHTDSVPHTQDAIRLQVCSPLSCLPEQELAIQMHPTRLTVQNSSIHVREGTIYKFKQSDFNVSAPLEYDINIVIFKSPEHGELYIETPFSNSTASYFDLEDVSKLRYRNSKLEHLMDRVEINVEADGSGGDPQLLQFILWIVIEPVNHHAPEIIKLVDNLTIVQGTTVPITSSLFIAHDSDVGSDDDDLQWTPSEGQISGFLFLEGEAERATNWTEGDIRNNRLFYRNTVHRPDFLILKVSDGEKEATLEFLIYVVLVNLKKFPVEPYLVKEGDNKTITYTHLRYRADNDFTLDDSDLLITMVSIPQHGWLTLDSRVLRHGDTFTQDRINSSRLLYFHDDSNTRRDSFLFLISVPSRKGGSKTDRFEIIIEPFDDDPPVAIIPAHMFVVELGKVPIEVRIVDEDSVTSKASDRVVGQLIQPLQHGRLVKNRQGAVTNHTENFTKYELEHEEVLYEQLGLHHTQQDHLVFNLTDGNNNTQNRTYNLTIVILPHTVSMRLSPLTVTEEELGEITAEEISVNHRYLRTVAGTVRVVQGPQHGKLVNTRTGSRSGEAIHSFTTGDIKNNSIRYYHNGDEGLRDSFQFVYEPMEPPNYLRTSRVETFYINIIPVNDQRPVIHGNASLKLWAQETVVLSEQTLNITDRDTARDKLNITFQVRTIGGYIAFANNTAGAGGAIHWFTQADVRAHRVMFVHVDGPEGQIVYNVTDGEFIETSTISIYADTLALECPIHQWHPIRVKFLESIPLTTDNLHCTTSDALNDREITYRISGSQLGHFEVGSETKSKFTSTEVRAKLVRFVHSETYMWLERERLPVFATSDPASPESDLPLVVEVQYPQSPHGSRLAVNTGLNLAEGGTALINETVLDGRNLRYADWLSLPSPQDTPLRDLIVVYRVLQPPRHGNLTVSGTPVSAFTQMDLARASVRYQHDDSEMLSETLFLNVTVLHANDAVISSHDLEALHITVTPVNDQRPLLKTTALEKSLVQNFPTVLSAVDLEVVDGDNPPEQLQLVLLSVPNNTRLLLNESVLTANSSITQHHINQGWVSLHPFAVGVGRLSFSLTDGTLTGDGVQQFVLSVEEHYLRQVTLRDIEYNQNETLVIVGGEFVDTQTNGRRSETVFTILDGLCCGHIMVAGQEVNTFTQEDVDHSLVSYVPMSGAYQDGFSLNITNHNQSLTAILSVASVVLGHVHKTGVHFTMNSSHLVKVLPPDILLLDELRDVTSDVPIIQVLKAPKYGHLERRIAEISIAKRATKEIREFRYDDLQYGWIVYVWDSIMAVEDNRTESFEVLVTANGVFPAKAVITFTISPPSPVTPDPMSDPISAPGTTPPRHSATAVGSESGGGFPVYTLVPIIGIILFLLLLIIVVVIFCLIQQKRVKKKWVPTFPHLHHQLPWSAASPPVPAQITPYDYDPSGMPSGENDYHNSDTSSGFSEPDCSPRNTPIESGLPLHPSSPSFHLPRSRMRSNVSITFSSRQSTASGEMSMDGDTFVHSSVSQYPPQTPAAVLPPRPASYMTCRPAVGDSGLVSLTSGEIHTGEEVPADEGTFAEWTEGKALPDFSDPNIQRLFHAHNPVLKKEEYWV